ALYSAAERGDTSAVRSLLDKGILEIIEFVGNGSLLHDAIATQSVSVISTLLACGVDTEARNMNYRTPLHIAAEIGRVEAVKLLVEKEGANVNVLDTKGKTPL
ncbi:ankyrin, partial [Choiromyces venosus 120613-1]